MSQPVEGAENHEESVELVSSGDAAFSQLMDFLVPEAGAEAGSEVDGENLTGEATGGQPAGAAEIVGSEDPATGAPAAGVSGQQAIPGATSGASESGGHSAPPASWTADAATLAPQWGEVSTGIENAFLQRHQDTALAEVKTDYQKFFDTLNMHARELVGMEVPRVDGKEGMEILRDSADAKEWQDAVRSQLIREVQHRANLSAEGERDSISVLHSSVDLFRNNADLIPGTKQFDVDLANQFVQLAKDYELRVDGKLQGYNINVQPLINTARKQLQAQRAAAPVSKQAAKTPAPASAGPQRGIPNKAGSSSGTQESFESLFGTIGMSGFRI